MLNIRRKRLDYRTGHKSIHIEEAWKIEEKDVLADKGAPPEESLHIALLSANMLKAVISKQNIQWLDNYSLFKKASLNRLIRRRYPYPPPS